jgi:hypothetical protein
MHSSISLHAAVVPISATMPGYKSIKDIYSDMLLSWKRYNSIIASHSRQSYYYASITDENTAAAAAIDTIADVGYWRPQIAPFDSALKGDVGAYFDFAILLFIGEMRHMLV